MMTHDRGLCALPIQDQQAVRAGVAHLQRLGSRALCEVLVDLARSRGGIDQLVCLMGEVTWLQPEMLRVTGGDRFPPRPLRRVAQ